MDRLNPAADSALGLAGSHRLKSSGRFSAAEKPNRIGIFEQDRIISRRPSILAWRADDLGAERLEKTMQLIDVGALTGTETEVMQTDALLLEGRAFMLG